MLLLIDAGNTNTVFALSNGTEILSVWRCRTDSARTADEYASWLAPLMLMKGFAFQAVERTIASSVVPDANFNLSRLSKIYFEQEVEFIGRNGLMPRLDILLDKPEEIGADRIVNAIAVRTHYPLPAIVLDFGTATTFDVVDGQGRYAGGAIAPGINLSVNALHQAAAKLPRIGIQRPPQATGKNTIMAMQSGIYWGYVGLVNGIVSRLTEELGTNPHVVATGGLAPLFARDLPIIQAVDDTLILKGLLAIAIKQF